MAMSKRNENMDMLRFIAIYSVVCIHYIGWGEHLMLMYQL